jgi:hypothetical protein
MSHKLRIQGLARNTSTWLGGASADDPAWRGGQSVQRTALPSALRTHMCVRVTPTHAPHAPLLPPLQAALAAQRTRRRERCGQHLPFECDAS